MLIKSEIKNIEDKMQFCVWLYLEYVNSSLDVRTFTNKIEIMKDGDIYNLSEKIITCIINNGKDLYNRGYKPLDNEKLKQYVER